MIHQILGASCLAPFRPGHDYRPALDELVGMGFGLVRTFCGPLPWCAQERSDVYDRLATYLKDCADRGLNAYLSYCTEAGTGYDLETHVSTLENIAADHFAVVVREIANEPWHPSQANRLSPELCAQLMNERTLKRATCSLGAAEDDESLDYAGGDFVPVHLDRGRDRWNMVRRVREIMAVSESTGKPALNQEPIGADETEQPGKRLNDPAVFMCMGALNRLFLGGSGVFHSQAGLMAERMGQTQVSCAGHYLVGATIWPGAHRLVYKNVGHTGSPFKDANFDKVVRIYSGLEANEAEGFCVFVGATPDATWEMNDGWQLGEPLAGAMTGQDGRQCRVHRVVRG